MKLIVDADACPVLEYIDLVCQDYKCFAICDYSHHLNCENIEIINVDQGSDSADFKILDLTDEGDVVITNDIGLSSLVISKGGRVLNFNGDVINKNNIDSFLEFRYLSAKLRKDGTHLKGPKKRDNSQNKQFVESLEKLLINLKK